MSTHHHLHAGHSGSTDPTNTRVLREREFIPAFTTRFRALKGAIRTTVGYENDALRLRQQATAAADDITPTDSFTFRNDPEAKDAFMQWLQEQINRGVLEPAPRSQLRNGTHYTARYIRSAAERGWDDAAQNLQEQGIDVKPEDLAKTFGQGVAEEQLAMAYTRTFDDLENITQDIQTEIRRQLTRGLAEGWNPRKMASNLNHEVDLGLNRARTIARTETIRNYNDFALTRYERNSVGSVTIDAEWEAAGDKRVCPICLTLDGNVYTIKEARTETFHFDASGEDVPNSLAGEYPVHPPAHPNCRCSFKPAIR